MQIDSYNGYPIIYDEVTHEMVYKDNRIKYETIKNAYESPMDRIRISNDIIMIKSEFFVTMGCLKLTNQKIESFIEKIKTWTKLQKRNVSGTKKRNLN